MALLTKNTKDLADYQQWTAAQIANGDILGVYESLNRAAHSVTIESLGGQTVVRFNVSHKVHGQYGPGNESWVGLGQGTTRDRPRVETEVELTKENITIEEDHTQTWSMTEISVRDIKVVSKAPNLKITVT